MSDCEQATFSISSVVRGYHAYKDIWQPDVGEELRCQREVGNLVARCFCGRGYEGRDGCRSRPEEDFLHLLTLLAQKLFDYLSCDWFQKVF